MELLLIKEDKLGKNPWLKGDIVAVVLESAPLEKQDFDIVVWDIPDSLLGRYQKNLLEPGYTQTINRYMKGGVRRIKYLPNYDELSSRSHYFINDSGKLGRRK